MSGGHGVRPYDFAKDHMMALYQEIMGVPEVVIEEFVLQHSVLYTLSPRVVKTPQYGKRYHGKVYDITIRKR